MVPVAAYREVAYSYRGQWLVQGPDYLPLYLSIGIRQSVALSTVLSIDLSVALSFYLSADLPVYCSIYPLTYQSVTLSIDLSICYFNFLLICPSIPLSFDLCKYYTIYHTV